MRLNGLAIGSRTGTCVILSSAMVTSHAIPGATTLDSVYHALMTSLCPNLSERCSNPSSSVPKKKRAGGDDARVLPHAHHQPLLHLAPSPPSQLG